MSAHAINDDLDHAALGPPAEGPGRRLRNARQSRGLDLNRIASQLHLKPAMVAALEQDNYDALPGSVFVLGYIRNYARLLNLDPAPLIAEFRSSEPQPEPPRPRVGRRTPRQAGSGSLLVRLVSLILVAAVAGLSYLWWQNQRPAVYPYAVGETSVSGSLDLDAPEDSAPVDAAPAPDDAMGAFAAPDRPRPEPAAPTANPEPAEPTFAGDEAKPAASLLGDRPAPFPMATPAAPGPSADTTGWGSDEATTEQVAAEAEADGGDAALAVPGGVVMEFSGPCWVDIRDSERRFKIFGEMGKGDRRVLEGTPPYSVILGNASAVRISINGEPFDLESVARGNVARFTLDPARLP